MSSEQELELLYDQALVAITALKNFRGVPLEDNIDKLEGLSEAIVDAVNDLEAEIEEDRETDYYDPSDEYDGSIVPPRDYS